MCLYIKLSDVVTCWACMAPLLTSPEPLLHLSCTSPDLSCTPPAPLLTPAAPLFPAPLQQKLEGFPKDTSNHFKKKWEAMQSFFVLLYIELSDVITCWACMAPLLTSPAPLLHLSCTPPAPLLTPAAPLFPAPLQQKLDTSNHFKTNAKLCKAFMRFYVKLSDVVTCWACLMHPSCTSPDPCCTFLCCTSPAEVRRRSF